MSGAYYPNIWFPPIARLHEYIAIAWSPEKIKYYKVVLPPEPIPLFEKGFLLKPGESLTEQELTEISVGDNEVLQLRIALDGVIRVKAKLPKAVSRWTLRRESAYLEPSIAQFPTFPPVAEMYILEDMKLYVDIQNLNSDRYEYGKIYITGYRIVIEEVKEKPRAYAGILIQGFAPRTGSG